MKKNRTKRNVLALIRFELLFKAIFMVLMVPCFNYAFSLAIKMSGYSYVTLRNLFSFLTKPFTIATIVLGIMVAGTFIYFELISLSIYYEKRKTINDMKVLHIVYSGFAIANHVIKQKRCRLLPLYSLLCAIVYTLPIYLFMATRQRVPLYLLSKIMSNVWGIVLLLVVIILPVCIVYLGSFSIPLCCFYQLGFREAYQLSCKKMIKHGKKVAAVILFKNLCLFAGYVFFYIILILLCGTITYFTFPISLRRAAFLIAYDYLNRYYAVVAGVFGILYHLKLMKHYMEVLDVPAGHKSRYLEINEVTENIVVMNELWEERVQASRWIRWMRIVIIAGLCCLLFKTMSLNQGILFQKSSIFDPKITAHRGYTKGSPENSLPAIKNAIDSMSDFTEIDVQETKDGVVVLLHDQDLKRTHRVNKSIWELYYYELDKYLLPYQTEDDYGVTGIPTLEQVLLLCKDKININIELKMTRHEQGLPEKVAAIVREYGMEEQCVISSNSLSSLSRIKKANENLKTGYIISLAYGYFYNNPDIDFLSVKSSFITPEMVRIAHSNGKEVHAWTVNSFSEIERMKQIQVDNIITDYPVRVRELVFGTKLPESFQQFLKLLTK